MRSIESDHFPLGEKIIISNTDCSVEKLQRTEKITGVGYVYFPSIALKPNSVEAKLCRGDHSMIANCSALRHT